MHIGSTVQWHIQDDKTDFAMENTWILAAINAKARTND